MMPYQVVGTSFDTEKDWMISTWHYPTFSLHCTECWSQSSASKLDETDHRSWPIFSEASVFPVWTTSLFPWASLLQVSNTLYRCFCVLAIISVHFLFPISIILASHYPEKVGHVDVISDAKNVKKLLMLPYRSLYQYYTPVPLPLNSPWLYSPLWRVVAPPSNNCSFSTPSSHSDVSMVIHRAGNTLLLDELKPSVMTLRVWLL